MNCCGADKCCVCDLSDEEVRLMRVSGKAKFLIFVLRKWKADKKLQSMKGVVPSDDYFEKQKQEVLQFKASQVANDKAGMPCVDTGSLSTEAEQSMWESFAELEEQDAHKRAFGGNVGAPAINLDSAGNLITPWGNSEPPVAPDRSIGSMLADDEVAELRDADAAMSELYDLNENKDDYLTSAQPPAIVKARTMETFPTSTFLPRPPSMVPFDIGSPSSSAAKFDFGSPPPQQSGFSVILSKRIRDCCWPTSCHRKHPLRHFLRLEIARNCCA